MILTDYFRSEKDAAWDISRECGVRHGTIRLPESTDFNVTDEHHWQTVYDRFMNFGIEPIIIEPMPNDLHDHIKAGDSQRDESIDRVIRMLPIMEKLDIRMICFNFMAHVGWTRTETDIEERGGARVTGFNLGHYLPRGARITEEELWANYSYFLKAVVPEAEKHGIKLALHPDDPPLPKLGEVSRIMVTTGQIRHAVRDIVDSPALGITMCQATFSLMGGDIYETISAFRDKIFFVHFRNVVGNKENFHETFRDNGTLDMARLIRHYHNLGLKVPVRVDHVPTLVGEDTVHAGYDALGRLYAIGYLKGLLQMAESYQDTEE